MWHAGQPIEHFRVDSGEPNPQQNLSPMMEIAPLTDIDTVRAEFTARSAEIDPAVRAQVLAVLEQEMKPKVVILGENSPGGVYLLRIRLAADSEVSFGRFRNGDPLSLEAGEYVYIGSAHGRRGSSTLANRLLRHATRSKGKPHLIQEELVQVLSDAGLVGKLPTKKTVRWHIDYLLDLQEAEITGVLAYRATEQVEKPLAERLETDEHTHPVAPGLGASDHPGHSHLVKVVVNDDWWDSLDENYELH